MCGIWADAGVVVADRARKKSVVRRNPAPLANSISGGNVKVEQAHGVELFHGC